MRVVLLVALLAALPCGAQDLPDPGRRLSKEEQEADPEKRAPTKPPARQPAHRPRDAAACDRARTYYRLACGAPDSRRAQSQDCAEAYALYRSSCP